MVAHKKPLPEPRDPHEDPGGESSSLQGFAAKATDLLGSRYDTPGAAEAADRKSADMVPGLLLTLAGKRVPSLIRPIHRRFPILSCFKKQMWDWSTAELCLEAGVSQS